MKGPCTADVPSQRQTIAILGRIGQRSSIRRQVSWRILAILVQVTPREGKINSKLSEGIFFPSCKTKQRQEVYSLLNSQDRERGRGEGDAEYKSNARNTQEQEVGQMDELRG